MAQDTKHFPNLGFGLGLRIPHYAHIFEHWPKVDWFEIISENFMDTGGRPIRNLQRIREHYPVVMHGIGMSIGTIDPLNSEYLAKLKNLIGWLEPAWVSDHLCWTGVAHRNSHDLLPVPYTEESLAHMIERISQVQDFLGRPIALENPSTYLEFKTSHIPEAEFIREMAARSGCHLLLDVNNVYVSSYNHRLDPKAYIDTLPLDKVAQIHLSGHTNKGTHIVDTHDDHVVDEVWALYRYVVNKAGRTPNTMIEWDDNIPEWDVLYAELGKAKDAAKNAKNVGELPKLDTGEARYVSNISVPLGAEQSRMQEAILKGERTDSKPDEWIRAKEQFPADAQLSVYIDSYRFRLFDVVAEDFPVLKYYLGADAFNELIDDFVNNVESDHFNISRFAAKLPAFLASHKAADDFAVEICALENALSQLMDSEETLPLSPEHLAGMTPEALMESLLHPRKALELFSFAYPIDAYYTAVKEEKNPKKPKKKASFLAVFRHDDVVWRMPISGQEFHLLAKLFGGMSIGEALEETQKELKLSDDALAGELMNWFSRWMRNGMLACNEAA